MLPGMAAWSRQYQTNGNYVFIQHGEQFETHYLHLHRLKVKQGARVKQGDVIGTVSPVLRPPHLHYEFLVNGVHRIRAPCTKFAQSEIAARSGTPPTSPAAHASIRLLRPARSSSK